MVRGRSWGVVGVVVVVAAAIGYVAFAATRDQNAGDVPPGCRVSLDGATFTMSPEQASHATTIAAVGKRLGMPDHAVSVALAAALQESKLYNLDYGDRDSLGLFQQRPSQGWGTPTEVLTPHYAASAFYRRLARVPGWETLPVTTAAQRVQRSSAPDAYAQWELQARAIAQAATGEIPAGLSCRVDVGATQSSGKPLRQALARELGPFTLDVPVPDARGWTVAAWLVGHAQEFGVSQVTFAGQAWTPSSGRWLASGGPIEMTVRVTEER
ncbi:MAG TPA: hypothetical protein VKE97_05530 [Acidimicrobiia bacterium]|nr:hypothetical protein [Acidimicrobiia bacterium]